MSKIEGKFYPLQHEEWVQTVKNLTGVEIKVLYYLRSLDPFGDLDLEYGVSDIATDLGVSKGAVSKALKRLDQLSLINILLVKVRIRVKLGNQVSYRKQANPIGNYQTLQETEKSYRKLENPIGNDQAPEPLSGNGSTTPHTNKTYSDFKDSLSDSERESFLDFGKKKAGQLPHPPELPQRWIEKNFDELRSQWYKSTGQTSPVQSAKWEVDPRRQEWMDKIRSLGFAAFIYESSDLDKERKEFYEWANSNNLIWGDET